MGPTRPARFPLGLAISDAHIHWGTYPPCDIDKVRDRGETRPVDPEMREALDQFGTDLRGEIRSVDADLRGAINQLAVDLRGEIRSGDAETRQALDRMGADLRGEFRTAVVEMRCYFDVVGESLRSDIRAVTEGMALSLEQRDRRIDEEMGWTDGLEGRVLRLEVRVTSLEDDRKPRRPRRRS